MAARPVKTTLAPRHPWHRHPRSQIMPALPAVTAASRITSWTARTAPTSAWIGAAARLIGRTRRQDSEVSEKKKKSSATLENLGQSS